MPHPRRRLALIALTAVFIVAGAAAALWWWLDGRWHTSTDDAYVQGNLVQLTPQIAGIVIRINADDTALVREGDPVVVLDDADTRTALDEAKAGLAQAVRRVRQLYANTDALRASVELRRAEWRRAQDDLQRRTGLPDARALAEEDLKHAQAQLETAAAALKAAEQQLAASEAMVSRTTVATHPDVEQAAAKLRESYLAAQRASVLAPVTGYVARRSVQLGEQVAPGAPLLAIVPLEQVWVDANFKETQLEYVRIGQPATLTSDLYGGAVMYHGTVIGLGSGTGSAFALLPPQNATGKLDQDRAAAAGAHPARPAGAGGAPAAGRVVHERLDRHARPQRRGARQRPADAAGRSDAGLRARARRRRPARARDRAGEPRGRRRCF
jgi:membrane fusion protein (multidrug efflux system)